MQKYIALIESFTKRTTVLLSILLIITCIAVSVHYAEQKPIDRITRNTLVIACDAGGSMHLFEVNISYYTTWFVDYVNPVNISIRPLSVLDKPLTVVASATLDKITSSKFLGYLQGADILYSSIEIPITSSTIHVSAEREIRELRLTFNITEIRCRHSASLWIVVAKITSALNIGIDVEPSTVEVGQATEIRILLTNPSPAFLTNVDLYVYINNSIVYSSRIPIIRPYENIFIANSVRYTAEKPGIYIVKARAIYTPHSATQGVSDAITTFTAKLRPLLSISAGRTMVNTGETVLLTGSIEPRIEDEKIVELEVSFDGVSWRSLTRLRLSNSSFSYNFVPEEPQIHYLRFKLIESRTFLPSTSNIISVAVEKVKPYVRINTDWLFAEENSNISIRVRVSPPIVDTIEIMYKTSEEYSWRKIQAKVGKNVEETAVSLRLTRPGIYEVKAVIPETKNYYGAESNTIQVYVRPRESTMSATQTQVQTTVAVVESSIELRQNTAFIVIPVAFAIATAILLLALRRK